ncbi:MAG: hypothetical protein LV471_09115 [Nitrosomonas sp.]|nr:hypothetical protein [Nitrosomonas sp.]
MMINKIPESDEAALNAARNWLGFVTLPDHISSITNTTESAEADRERYKQKKSPYEIQTFATRKLIRGLTVCLNAGMINNNDIYHLLMDRGFLAKKDGRIITRQTVNQYLRAVRERLGLVRKDKKTMICEMFDQGKRMKQIAELINSTPMYVYQTLKNNGYKVNRGDAL